MQALTAARTSGNQAGVAAGAAGASARTAGRPAPARTRPAAGAGPGLGAGGTCGHDHRRDRRGTQIRLDRKHVSLLVLAAPHGVTRTSRDNFAVALQEERSNVTICIRASRASCRLPASLLKVLA